MGCVKIDYKDLTKTIHLSLHESPIKMSTIEIIIVLDADSTNIFAAYYSIIVTLS